MKKSIFISVFCLFFLGIACAAEEQESPEDFKKIELVWNQLFDKMNERLSGLESDFKAEKMQRQEFNSKINDNLNSLTKTINERIDKVEKTGSILETNNIAKSFKDTIGALNKNSSEMDKRLEVLEVNVAAIEKIYHVSQKPLETLMKVIDEQAVVINKINERQKKQEKMLLVMGKSSVIPVAHRKPVKVPGYVATDIEKKVETLPGASDGTKKSDTVSTVNQKHSGPEKNIFIENVALRSTRISTRIIGKIINNSNTDYAVANFKIQFYDGNNKILKNIDFVTTNFKIGSEKEFDELITGIDRESIARYIILFNDTELTTSRREKKVQIAEKKKTKEVKTDVKKTYPLPAVEKTINKAKVIPVKGKGFKVICDDFHVRNIAFSEFGSSTNMKGEIKNNSRENFSSASFGLKVLGKDSNIKFETEFSIVNINSNEIKPFDQTITGVRPSEILKYKIVCKKTR